MSEYPIPSEICRKCGAVSPTWFTDNDLWNLIGEVGILCPKCFIELAENKGIKTTGWKIVPEERIRREQSNGK